MKSFFFSAVLVLIILFCATHWCNATISCGLVDGKAAACLKFAQGVDKVPSGLCCTGLQQLVQSVRSVDDKKDICRCLKAAVKNFAGVQDKFLSAIPNSCNPKIKVGFPVSLNTNCESLH